MKALVLSEYKKLDYTEVPRPQIEANEVLIRVKACGICGSDVHGYDGSTGRRRPPVIMGHEASGVVEETGPEVKGWFPGDRVTFDSTIYCNECESCRHGDVNLCDNRRVIGVSCEDYRRDGAFAEYIAVPQHILYKIPDAVTFDQAAMIEPLSIAFHAANLAQHPIGASAAIVGTGKIGMLLIQTMRMFGFGTIAAVKHSPSNRAFIEALGADICLSSETDDIKAAADGLTGGKGFDYVFEAAGTEKTIRLSIELCKRNGNIILIGNSSPNVSVPLQAIVTKQLHISGSCASAGEYAACLDMIARKQIDVDKLIGTRAPLSEGAYWFEKLYSEHGDNLKVILNP
ncbi:MAG: galactitol-1-phosphate 5-dehydrogenase [Flexilinea sp.]|nr:galactitol-1-phosphate 5-dehydrogenase [Flexilinea sp.]